MSLPAHFWAKVERTDTCWLWTGSRTNGYGRFGGPSAKRLRGYSTTLAHRILWEDVNGSVPAGLVLDHLCNNPPCVNPDHLEPVTNQENIRRHYERVETCPNGHPATPENRVPHYEKDYGDRCLPCRRRANREANRRRVARGLPVGTIPTWDIRVWAWANGIHVARKGPIPRAVAAAYFATSEQAAS